MKHLATAVNQSGAEYGEYTLMTLIEFTDARLEQLKKLRTLVASIDKQVIDLRQSFGHLTLWTSDANWLHVHELDNEATEKVYDAVCESEHGFVEIPKDVYDGLLRAHDVSDGEYTGKQLRTELDYKVLDARGIYFTCAEDNSPANFESQFVAWWQLFDEPAPKVEVPRLL